MVNNEFITILEGTRQEYVIPKRYVKEFSTEVVLNLDIKELVTFEAKKL
jgi:hypothetical protein